MASLVSTFPSVVVSSTSSLRGAIDACAALIVAGTTTAVGEVDACAGIVVVPTDASSALLSLIPLGAAFGSRTGTRCLEATTTDSTPVCPTGWAVPVSEGHALFISAVVVASGGTGTPAALSGVWVLEGAYTRAVAGQTDIIGAAMIRDDASLGSTLAAASADATFTYGALAPGSGTAVGICVTGVALTTVRWTAVVTVTDITQAS
jgi:hypothetical protein